ncbi:MAG: MFS transporter [Candidatus Heimdallarchaeota archaeon]
MAETKLEDRETTSRHRFWTFISFGCYNITWTIPTATMNLFMIIFYHTVVGLNPVWILVVVAINTIWAGLNDPLIGWLTDRNFKWTQKWGRRFPWIAIAIIPQSISLIMIFSPPGMVADIGPLPVMIWLLISLFLFDLFITLLEVHVAILRADKFRTETERRKYAGSWGFFDMIAQVLGMMLPPLFLFFGDTILSYAIMATIVAVIMIIFGVIFVLKGAREDKIIIDRYYSRDYERLHIFKGVFAVIKQRSFLALYAQYTLWLAATASIMTGMVAYLTTYILQTEDPDAMIPFMAALLLGSLISIPIWLKVLKKLNNNKKTYLIGSFILVALTMPLTFFQGFFDLLIMMFLFGIANGCVWSIGMPVLHSNAQDDFVVATGKNQKGIFVGTWAIIGLFTAFIDEAIIASVFTITGFKEGFPTYAALLAEVGPSTMISIQWGIRFLLGIIPAILILIGTLIFWKVYPLTQEKVLENKAKLLELGF